MKHNICILILIQLLNFQSFLQDIVMTGTILDSESNNPIEFVNIGVLHKNKGTISNLNGKFSLRVSKEFKNDSLTFITIKSTNVSYNQKAIVISY
ncbi:carboxypeptidase-like regulatory domain-containing protein [Winogradskyella thalassocola]|uniref:CarboxypepD_reg-like domain-containing protein n=1 Tax=Winogradskyella thalassocola TaxID=262004 RepID=A0A1G7WD79_9FLAO|nr:carboxypeptidase-like regulatory domain-containing protein [Winogradskyella thalassocola]SDG69784.1 CarboxypepD_reg-like domain-containing protein [Winogradskyella thalassocola]